MGGRAALTFALRHPRCVAALILIGASPGIADPKERALRLEQDGRLADQLETGDDFGRFVDQWEQLPLLRSQFQIPAPWGDRLRKRRRRQNPLELARSLRGAGTGTMRPDS